MRGLGFFNTGGTELLQQAFLKLTNAQILALPTTPVEIVAYPGTGKYLVPVTCTVDADFTAGGYTNVSDSSDNQGATDVVVTYGANITNAFRPCAFGDIGGFGNARRVFFCSAVEIVSDPIAVTDGVFAISHGFPFDAGNFMVSADNAGGNFTGGNAANFLAVTVWYLVRTFGATS